MVADMGNEWESRAKINSCRQCRNVRDEFDVIVISNRRNKIIFELFVQSFERSIYRILSKFIELLGYLSPVRINIALLRIYFSFYESQMLFAFHKDFIGRNILRVYRALLWSRRSVQGLRGFKFHARGIQNSHDLSTSISDFLLTNLSIF